ncbi:hypothetical protein BG015_010066 [Linnemannia schmuckeri]|uniref:RING-type domain-containing protein n=1 Tax=Linnemannia schmuckeri TaxID=64567 RepID=A0A9P5RY50_9FUNG|nr:hypothetical protein BG015_010066 [Linnemannia schmuckeri]
MGQANSSLGQGVDWIRNQGSALSTRQSGRPTHRRQRGGNGGPRRRRRGGPQRDVEAQNGQDHTDDDDDDDSDYDSLDDNDDERDENDDDDDSLLEEEEGEAVAGKGAYDRHPLYFGPAFHPVTEQSPAQLQLQRQIEQQLEQQQRQEYWQQQYRQQQQQQQQQPQQQPQLSPLSNIGGQQLSLNDFILPSAVSGMGGISPEDTGTGANGGGVGTGVGTGIGSPGNSVYPSQQTSPMLTAEMAQDQLYRNSNLYNLISGLNVNPLLTEVQRAGTLDLSVLEQELDDVEGGWMDIKDEDENNQDRDDDDTDIDYGYDGIIREMQPTKRSPTALACNINLKKSSLRLVKNFTVSNDPSIPAPSHLRPNYRLDFSFDSLTPCDVKLFWVVKEVEEDGDLGFRLRRLHHLPQPTTYHFPAGMNQRFISPLLPLYTMSLPELTMQGLPSTSMRMFQKRQQRQWQQLNNFMSKEGLEGQEFEGEGDDETGSGRRGSRKSKSKKKSKKNGKGGGGSAYDNYYNNNKGMPFSGLDEDGCKAIMEDQYYPLVILIETTKEYNPTAPVRSLPIPAADSPGLYLVDNQAISTFACFNISSEGGFEIKVMKQKVWINSTNYLIQEIYGFTDSVATPMPKAPEPAALKKVATAGGSTPVARGKAHADPLAAASSSDPSKRLSRADSIVSRVQELTKERPKRKKSTLAKSKEIIEDKAGDEKSDGRRLSRVNAVMSLDIANPERAASRPSVSTRRRMSSDSIESQATSAIGGPMFQAGNDYELSQAGTNKSESGEEEVEDEEGEEEEEEEEPNLVLLDAPECVICLSDVKDTIVLPCRHFCICSDCGDVLRRRAPQRCPICRQVFQALLHIASTPLRKPEFAMVHSPASTPASNSVVNGAHHLQQP